jgi:hypothetical protein
VGDAVDEGRRTTVVAEDADQENHQQELPEGH